MVRFILIGQAGSGKDTVAEYLVNGYDFTQYSFAEKLKRVASDLFPEQLKADRRSLLQQLGVKLRELNEDVWVNYLLATIYSEMEVRAVITDCRFQNEYDLCIERGFIPVKVNCEDIVRSDRLFKRDGRRMTAEEKSHVSEQLNVPCDYHLDNSHSFNHLHEQIDKMLEGVAGCQ